MKTYIDKAYTLGIISTLYDSIPEHNKILDKAHEAVVAIPEAIVPRWISVEERLPEEWKTVLTFQPTTTDDKGIIQTCVYIGIPGKWRQAWNHEFLELPVTHWMSLPMPPEGETE